MHIKIKFGNLKGKKTKSDLYGNNFTPGTPGNQSKGMPNGVGNKMIGYKAFNKDLTCKGFQYKVNETYEMEEEPIPCKQGFHFCKSIAECYNYYDMTNDTRICKVEALGDVKTDDGIKYCTNKIKIVEEITEGWKRKGNTKSTNCGYINSGDCNSGNWNSGNWNSGYRNYGNCNSGSENFGSCNSGDHNSGNRNSGYRNSGDHNSGYWNSGYWNSGTFNTDKNPKIRMFDKESDWTIRDWEDSRAIIVMRKCPYTYSDFVPSNKMTEEEKENHPEYKTIGGFVKVLEFPAADKQKWWDGLSEEDKQAVLGLPNFDKDKFKECTEIEV